LIKIKYNIGEIESEFKIGKYKLPNCFSNCLFPPLNKLKLKSKNAENNKIFGNILLKEWKKLKKKGKDNNLIEINNLIKNVLINWNCEKIERINKNLERKIKNENKVYFKI